MIKATQGTIAKILWRITLPMVCILGLTAYSRPALGQQIRASIIECKTPKSKKGKVCTINTNKGQRGTPVSVYNKKQAWIASGVIHTRIGNKAIVVLKETVKPIFKTYGIIVGANDDWNSSFTHTDAW